MKKLLSSVTGVFFFLMLSHSLVCAEYLINSTFDSAMGSWDRLRENNSSQFIQSTPCKTSSSSSHNNGVRYQQFEIVPAVTANLVADIVEAGLDPITNMKLDTMLALYCQPFDPTKPGANLMYMDDDGGGYPHAGLTHMQISLTQGQSYYLVISNYSDYIESGTYTLQLGDDFKHMHVLPDAIAALQVLADVDVAASNLGPLSDVNASGKVDLTKVIQVLREISDR